MEQFLAVNLFSIIQLIAFIGGGFWVVGQMKSAQLNQTVRLEAVELELSELRKVVVSIARQEERLTAIDQRMMAQGQRIDSTAMLLNGRLEAINNIVSGHTAQLNYNTRQIRRYGKPEETE